MNEADFWINLIQQINQSTNPPEIDQAQREKLLQIQQQPTLPTKLIIHTISQGAVYFTDRTSLNFPAIIPIHPLNAKQLLALEMALSNSAIALISGAPATGKTRIATNLAHAAIAHNKRVLILTDRASALTAYQTLPGYPFQLSQSQNYRNWIVEQLRLQHLAQPQMNYLPLHFLPDAELAKLRTPATLERWLPEIATTSIEELTALLQPEFPHLSHARVQLLAYRLKKLEPLLQQQLRLSRLYSNLSEQAITELSDRLIESPQIPILGTVAEFMQLRHQLLWQTKFDLVIVEEAQHLSLVELILLSGLTDKLVLFGQEVSLSSPSRQYSFFGESANCFTGLAQHLMPAYCCRLNAQFRLHPQIAFSVYPAISPDWVQTLTQRVSSNFPHLGHRLVWHDIPNATEGERILELLSSFNPQDSQQIGIITFSEIQRDWFYEHCPEEYKDIVIGTVAEWAGRECAIALLCCTGKPKNIDREAIKIALTRGQDYLIAFGDYDIWKQPGSLLRHIEFPKERRVVLS